MDLIEKKSNINRHPWELSRMDCLIKEIKQFSNGNTFLDIGCGDSFLDKNLIKEINLKELYGIDIYGKEEKINNKHYLINDYDKIKNKKFNNILMFDVLEHVPNDLLFLKNNVLPYLEKDGKIIMTVPAFQFLFSKHDIALKHYRRYTIKNIKKLCEELDLKIINYHYFYFSLLPLRIISKLLNRDNKANLWKYNEKHFITKFVRNVLNLDYFLSKKLKNIIVGLSLFIVIEKK